MENFVLLFATLFSIRLKARFILNVRISVAIKTSQVSLSNFLIWQVERVEFTADFMNIQLENFNAYPQFDLMSTNLFLLKVKMQLFTLFNCFSIINGKYFLLTKDFFRLFVFSLKRTIYFILICLSLMNQKVRSNSICFSFLFLCREVLLLFLYPM